MKWTRSGILGLMACAAAAVMLCTGIAHGATCEKWAGRVVSAQGVVEVKPAGETRWQPVKLNETYCPGDTIRTDRKSRADIALYNHPILRLDQNSTVTLGGMKDEKTSLVDMISGAALFFSRVTRNLEVRTATVNAGVEGTEFFIRVEEGKTDLTVFEGKVLASNAAGGLPVATGQSAVAEAGKAPVYRVVVRPRDAVHWALYYPPVLDGRTADLKEDGNDPRFYTTRASQLLAVGRVEEATADIDKAQKLDPKNSDAFALQSMIAVTQNEKGKALDLSRKAVESDPKSATARIALSYAQQAHFDLPGALGSVEEAVKMAPGNALAWARLAELQQSFGYLDKSLDAAKKAAALKPDLSRTQTVLGFAYLAEVKTGKSKGAFENAIKLDDADPLPRLGLGLSKIREGNLEEGRREIEIAMSLDPNNSIIRSYLGKAYYEEKRDKLATGQYEMAKSLDPSDPTPYFYDAIEKQTTNRPVEALQDMEKAIQRNDNRAVYRSRLLLDQDLAAREASLARIYNDLGFQWLGLIEGWKSVNNDPGNYSAHRFLSDSYASMPRHEIARVSELLQSQLLQPLNITPVQPRLAESNLFAVAAGGPGNLSSNEFNPLFERNRLALQANGIIGENSTAGEEVVVAGLYKNLSASVGQYYFKTDGFRTNNDVKDSIVDAFVQASISPKTSVQAEYRYRDNETGDLALRFFLYDYFSERRFGEETNSIRLGFMHAFSPGNRFLGNLMYQKGEFFDHDVNPIFGVFNKDTDQKQYSAEFQQQFGSNNVKAILGAGFFKLKGETTIGTVLDGAPFPLGVASRDVWHNNAYLYTYLNFLRNVSFTLGLSADSYSETDYIDRTQVNPKLGITWNPVAGTTLRGAALRTLKRSFISNQTLEPTQVAGFNQFFDDDNATESWLYGVAVDQKILEGLYGGAEYYQRKLEVPFSQEVGFNEDTGESIFETVKSDWKEWVGRAYLYWAPHKWFALSGEYLYEKFKREEDYNLGITDLTTQRVPLAVNFFHPSGFAATFQATYVAQEGAFWPQSLFPPPFDPETGNPIAVNAADRFWVMNAAIGYRLPKRYGFITVGAKNLFDRSFNYFDTDTANPVFQPARTFFAKINLSF